MKKLLACVLVLGLVWGLGACGKPAQSKSLYAHGLDVVGLLSEVTKLEDYGAFYTGNNEIQSIIQELGTHTYEEPQAVFAVHIPEDNLDSILGSGALDGASDALKENLRQRIFASLVTQFNAMAGTEKLAASSICAVGKTFVCNEASENVIYLYFYGDAAPIAVTFATGEDHTVTATGSFILYDGFSLDSLEKIPDMFGGFPVTITEVTPET